MEAQLCGDAHVQNLGSFAAPDGKLVFDINDFDETIRGPWEWDVKRMMASVALAGKELGHDDAACGAAAEACAESYCGFMGEFARMPFLEVARRQVRREGRIEPIHARAAVILSGHDAFKSIDFSHGIPTAFGATEPIVGITHPRSTMS